MSIFPNPYARFVLTRLIVAHADAAEISKLLHSDISDANLLIHPTTERGKDGKLRVVRKGLLVDWELSEVIRPGDRERTQEQCGVCLRLS